MRHRLGPQPFRGLPRQKIGGVERENQFREYGFDVRLARLERDRVGHFVAMFVDCVANFSEILQRSRTDFAAHDFCASRASDIKRAADSGGVAGICETTCPEAASIDATKSPRRLFPWKLRSLVRSSMIVFSRPFLDRF